MTLRDNEIAEVGVAVALAAAPAPAPPPALAPAVAPAAAHCAQRKASFNVFQPILLFVLLGIHRLVVVLAFTHKYYLDVTPRSTSRSPHTSQRISLLQPPGNGFNPLKLYIFRFG